MATTNDQELSNWTGWVFFAGIMMILSGIFDAIAGFTALLRPTWYVATPHALLVFNYTAWGWIDLMVGLIILLAGFSILHGSTWSRIVGVIMASISAIASLGNINSYPIWSIVIITVDILVIYALTVHGGELRDHA